MQRFLAIAAAALAVSFAGCATTSDTTSTAQKPMGEKEYRVGSRIPIKDPAGASTRTN